MFRLLIASKSHHQTLAKFYRTVEYLPVGSTRLSVTWRSSVVTAAVAQVHVLGPGTSACRGHGQKNKTKKKKTNKQKTPKKPQEKYLVVLFANDKF